MNYEDVANAQSQADIASSWHRSLISRMAGLRSAIDNAVLRNDGTEVRRLRDQLERMKREASAASEDAAGWRRLCRSLSR